MRVESVDPHDTQWEQDEVSYRVYFWSPRGNGWASDEYDVHEADIGEVLRWCRDHASTEPRFTLFAKTSRDGSPGLLRLAGWVPTRNDAPFGWVQPSGSDPEDG